MEEIIKLIEECEELELPNGVKGAIWKQDLIDKIEKYMNSDIQPERSGKSKELKDKIEHWIDIKNRDI